MSISLSAGRARTKARVALLALALAGTGVAGVASASASVVHPATSSTYRCTAASPEVCIGVDYSGTFVYDVKLNVKFPFYATSIGYGVGGPRMGGSASMGSGGPGWIGQVTFPVDQYAPGEYCGTASWNGGTATAACVNVP